MAGKPGKIFSWEDLGSAMMEAGFDESERKRLTIVLLRSRLAQFKPKGRRPMNDSELVEAAHVLTETGLSEWKAAGEAAKASLADEWEDQEPTQRRIYRKLRSKLGT